jgi:plasmid stabilization system protein ParE
MKRLRLASPAQTDYLEAIAYYEAQRPGLGREFEADIEEIFSRIQRHPEHFANATPTVRKARTLRFKFGIFFTVEGGEIGVLAVYHPSRNPDALRKRF